MNLPRIKICDCVTERTGKSHVAVSSAQYEALMGAAFWLLKLRSQGYVSAGHGRRIADEALSIVRATGIEIKADTDRDERLRAIGLRSAGLVEEKT